MKKIACFIYSVSLLLVLFLSATAQDVNVNDQKFSLKIAESKDVTLTAPTGSTLDISSMPTCCGGAVEIVKKSATDNLLILTFTGIKSSPSLSEIIIPLTLNGTPSSAKVTLTVIDPSKFTYVPSSVNDAIQKMEKRIQLKVPGTIIEDNRVKVDFNGGGTYGYSGGYISVNPNKDGDFNLSVKVDGVNLTPLQVHVNEGIGTFEVNRKIELFQGQELKLSDPKLGLKIIGGGVVPSDLTTQCQQMNANTIELDSNEGIIIKSDGKYYANPAKKGSTYFTLKCLGRSERIDVNVLPVQSEIRFEPQVASLDLNTQVTVEAAVIGKDQTKIEGDAGHITWSIPDSSLKFIEFTPDGNKVRLKLKEQPPAGTIFDITAKSIFGTPPVQKDLKGIPQKAFQVTDFAMLRMYLDPVDPVTLEHDFGSQLKKNYFVMKATLNNIVPSENGELYRAPILVYNQSIEAKVMFEYQDPWDKNWKIARQQQLIPNLVTNQALKLDENRNTRWSEIMDWLEGRGKWVGNGAPTGDYLVVPERRINDLKKCQVIEQLDYMYPIQPLKYETILLTQESRENGKWKHKLLTALLSLSSLTSFVTNLVGAGGDWPGGQSQFNNLMIPAYQKYFPDRREIHKDHLIQEMMLPLLEIPFGSQETKYLLFPKGEQPVSMPIKRKNQNGTWDYSTIEKIRIVGVSASDACANVAVIKKAP